MSDRPHAAVRPALPSARRASPSLLLGPFYPLSPAAGAGSALWRADAIPAGARRLELAVRVESLAGAPVAGVRVELWHADPAGHYRHPSAPHHDCVDPAFAGYGTAVTDAVGRVAFRSLAPGPYVDGAARRAPHLHLQLTGRIDRLVTQLFVPGAPGLREDRVLASASRPEALIPGVVRDDGDLLALTWTAVLRNG